MTGKKNLPSDTELRILKAVFTLMDEARLGICRVRDFRTKDGWVELANRHFLNLTGITEDRLPLNLPISELLPPGEIIRVLSYYRRYQRRGSQPKPYETVLVRTDGRELPVEIHPSRLDFFQPDSLLVLVRDISSRKRLQELLDSQNHMIRMLNSLTLVLQHCRDLKQTFSASLELALGLTRMEMGGIYLNRSGRLRLFQSSGQDGLLPGTLACRPYSRNRENRVLVYPQGPKKTAVKPDYFVELNGVEVRSQVLLPFSNERQGMLGLLVLSARRETRPGGQILKLLAVMGAQISQVLQNALLIDRLAESEAKYRTILNNATDGFVLFKGRRISDSNPAFESIVAQLTEDPGRIGPQFLQPEEPRDGFEYYSRHWEKMFTGTEGGRRWISISENPLELPGSQVAYFLRDITEKKQWESFNILSERLAASGRLAAAVAHEINNPLQAVIINLGLLNQSIRPDERQQELLDGIMTGFISMRTTVEQLLEIRPPERIRMRRVQVNEVLIKTLGLARGRLEKSGIVLRTNFASNLPKVRGSNPYLQRAFLNFMLNACDAMPAGGALSVHTYLHRGAIYIRFTDTGPGIEQDKIDRIFDVYYSTKTDKRGRGLGLAIALNLLRHHHGEVYVKSKPGSGASFTIRLPLVATAAGKG
ncbi:MAG: PAS domain S-box protein [Candidatus Glassbacteria bacterium]|nr:PAS domain S-box protein [Candidatus Glassbacteria bacterium]